MKRLVALALCAVMLLLPACSKKNTFSYFGGNLGEEYFTLSRSEITGGKYSIDIPQPITEEEAYRELRRQQLINAYYEDPKTALDCYLNKPAYGDKAMIYYDIRLSPEGESLVSNLFSEAGAFAVDIGYWEFPEFIDDFNPIFHGQAFSDALEETQPSDRVFTGKVAAGDVVVIDVDRVSKDGKLEKELVEVRIDTAFLSLYETFLPADLLNALVGKEIGKEFSVATTYLPEGAKEAVPVTYKCIVTHKLVEDYSMIEVKLDKDAFGKEYSETMQSLSGKTVYLYYTIARYVDYFVPALDRAFLVDTLGLPSDETDPEKLVKAAVDQIIYQKESEQLYNEICPRVTDVILDKIFATDRVKKYPESMVKAEYDKLIAEVSTAYKTDKASYEKEGKAFPYANIDAYAAYYYSYDPALYSSMEDFCDDEARYQIKLRLAIFTMAEVAGISYTIKERDSAFAAYMEYQNKYYTAKGVTLTEEERKLIYSSDVPSEGEKRYQEFVHLTIKFYKTVQGITLTQADVEAQFGTQANLYFRSIYRMVQMDVMKYIYENNTWTDTTP